MNIHHVTIETLKKVEHVSTAKIMEISLTGALRNVLTGMKRRLSRDIISNQCRRSIWIKWGRILKVKQRLWSQSSSIQITLPRRQENSTKASQ
jgi:hypothetical protein